MAGKQSFFFLSYFLLGSTLQVEANPVRQRISERHEEGVRQIQGVQKLGV